jgi:hypothetical protein
MTTGGEVVIAPSRSGRRWLTGGAVLVVLSLWLGTFPLTVFTQGDTDETTCGDAWGPLTDALPAACYSTFYWSGWLARIGLAVGLAMIALGVARWLRRRA